MSNSENQHKVVVLLGSPRKKGNSSIIAREIAAGAESVGAAVESIFIQEMDIKACQACWFCQKPDSHGCAIKDDMQKIFPKLIEADSWVIATPVHSFNKKIAIAIAYGDADPYASGAVNAIRSFQDSFRYVGAEITGVVYGSALERGDIEKNEAVLIAAKKLGKKLAG
jgi:flavodoxin